MKSQDQPANPADQFGWHEGDIEILREGTGEPLLSEAELARILRENGPPKRSPPPEESKPAQPPAADTAFEAAHRRFFRPRRS